MRRPRSWWPKRRQRTPRPSRQQAPKKSKTKTQELCKKGVPQSIPAARLFARLFDRVKFRGCCNCATAPFSPLMGKTHPTVFLPLASRLGLAVVFAGQLPAGRLDVPAVGYPHFYGEPRVFQPVLNQLHGLPAGLSDGAGAGLVVLQHVDHHVFPGEPFGQLALRRQACR